MTIRQLHVAGYRSIRDLRLRLDRVNLIVGPNGSGKSNLYRALGLVSSAASGALARALAEEGGMPSVLWAGARAKGPVRMTLAVEIDEFGYELECGLMPPVPGGSAFDLDPHVKSELVTFRQGRKSAVLLERSNATAHARDAEGARMTFPLVFSESESVLAELREPHRFPVISTIRDEIRAWRFYHQFRVDAASPLRQPQTGVRTPILSESALDLAAALRTIQEVGDRPGLEEAIDRAFPGGRLEVEAGRFVLRLAMPEFRRAFDARELSDGSMQYLCLVAALLSPRPPSLLALNEPESSIHPDLLEPLANLIAKAARSSQLWITTHSTPLADHLRRLTGAEPIELRKVAGETRIRS
ncbi:MAG: AAA family ATPase [Isosphaeraceae bacterium]|nr:AAA family ATPase [Isosphaeraceae bacterium]